MFYFKQHNATKKFPLLYLDGDYIKNLKGKTQTKNLDS